jgi:UDP-N-acetylglucosamine:LPS N-acetylglucosamine transferase
MSYRPKLLILTVKTGDGHINVAEALRDQLQEEKANLEFIQRYGVGWVALEPKRLRKLIAMLVTRSAELIPMPEKIQAYRQWNCAVNESIGAVLRTLMPGERFA